MPQDENGPNKESDKEKLPTRRKFSSTLNIGPQSEEQLGKMTPESVLAGSQEPGPSARSSATTSPVIPPQRVSSESEVCDESQTVVESFFVSAYNRQLRAEEVEAAAAHGGDVSPVPADPAATPYIRALAEYPDGSGPLSAPVRVGHYLAQLGDEFQRRHQNELDRMVQMVLPEILQSTSAGAMAVKAYEAFRSVAHRTFAQGITWGRILALMSFGYRLAIAVARHHLPNYAVDCIHFVVQFIVSERVAAWIARQGGWLTALSWYMADETGSMLSLWTVMAVSLASVFGVALLALFAGMRVAKPPPP